MRGDEQADICQSEDGEGILLTQFARQTLKRYRHLA
jgi:hypothetical protein